MNQVLRGKGPSFRSRISFPCVIAMMLLAGACDSASNKQEPIPLETRMAKDIPADPASGRDQTTGRAISNNLYTLYDFEEGKIVLASSVTDAAQRRADSTETDWDIGFKGTTIIFNGGESGPGEASAQILKQPMEEIGEAPASGYVKDGENTECPTVQTPSGPVPGSTLALCTGSGNGWYSYDPRQGLISPISGRSTVLKTATGNYAVFRILSYYKGNPNPPNAEAPSRHYTFEFIVQTDGSRDLRNTIDN